MFPKERWGHNQIKSLVHKWVIGENEESAWDQQQSSEMDISSTNNHQRASGGSRQRSRCESEPRATWRAECSAHNTLGRNSNVMTVDQSQNKLILSIWMTSFSKPSREGELALCGVVGTRASTRIYSLDLVSFWGCEVQAEQCEIMIIQWESQGKHNTLPVKVPVSKEQTSVELKWEEKAIDSATWERLDGI